MNKAATLNTLSYVTLQKARKQVGEIISDVFQHYPFPQITPGQLGGPLGRSCSSLVRVHPPSGKVGFGEKVTAIGESH